MADPIKISGLKEFQRAVKQLDASIPKAMRTAFNAAADIVVQEARPEIPSRSGRAKASVKARSTQTAVRVVGGGKKAPHYPWLDFGGRVGKNRSVRRPFLADGRYIYDAYYSNRARVQEGTRVALVDAAEAAGLAVDGG